MFEKFKKWVEKERKIEAEASVEKATEDPNTITKIIKKNVTTDYENCGLVDLITNSIDITIGVMVQLGLDYDVKPHWEYYVELFNCCNHENFIEAVAPDVKSKLLCFHSLPWAYVALSKFTRDEYEQATAIAVKKKKEDIMKFWNEYVEKQTVG